MSSYISPAAQGDAKATGAYATAIAAQAGGTNNDGHATDSNGNVVVDFVWGNFPLQPNDVRRASVTNFGGAHGSDVATVNSSDILKNIPGKDADYGWSATTQVTSDNLAYGNITKSLNNGITFAVKPDSHEIAESAYVGYPNYVRGNAAVYIITQASGDGSTQTYTAPNNFLKAGDVVNITGTGLDGNSLTVATANRYTFTVSGSSTGDYINISGRARYADELTANDGAYIAGVDYIKVPNVVGLTTALAQDALNDAEFGTITVASAVTPAISNVALTSNVATLTTSAAHGYAVGDSVVIASLVNGGGSASADADLNGTYTLTSGTTGSTLKFAKTHTDITSHSVSAGTAKVMAKAGTIKTQSVAAGASSIAAGASITITPYFAS
jgi:hypothetical protein